MPNLTRRRFLENSVLAAAVASLPNRLPAADPPAVRPADRPARPAGITVLNPRARVPVSMIVDDSTCLVNLAHFGIPQFAEVFPDRYKQDWRKLPREIPDSFVREFGEWCHDHGVKGKYSIVPCPALVGWVDREMPGWSHRELQASLELVRTLMLPDWDIHPEMITHTRVIETKTGRPFPEATEFFMENWRWTDDKSVDQIADYIAYALRILKNAGLPCEGMTTPSGFGGRVLTKLSLANLQACRDVFQAEIPHYFFHLFTDHHSVAPRVECPSGLDGPDPKCCVSIVGCTGDWFGGWDGLQRGSVDKLITADLQGGRLPEIIARGEPAIMVSHWPGIYFNGERVGFDIFKEAVRRLHAGFDNLIWMKLSEISRYWAAKELTRIERAGNKVAFAAPFAAPAFTVQTSAAPQAVPSLFVNKQPVPLTEVKRPLDLKSGAWMRSGSGVTVCFDLPKGSSWLEV